MTVRKLDGRVVADLPTLVDQIPGATKGGIKRLCRPVTRQLGEDLYDLAEVQAALVLDAARSKRRGPSTRHLLKVAKR
jgi:hypothetical protein